MVPILKPIYLILPLLLAVLLTGTAVFAATPSKPTQGLFTSVSGTVKVTSKSGAKTRTAQKDSTVVEGEQIVTGKNSEATLHFFDGSDLNISPGTKLVLTKMQKSPTLDKILLFKLFVGNLLAKVQKLATSKSSFEIEAGGVVCGVRGTQFDYSYDPANQKVTVKVDDGKVWVDVNKNTYVFIGGQKGIFLNGIPDPTNPGQAPKGGKPTSGNPTGLGSLDDLNQQFGNGLAVNGDNNFTNPGVEGSLRVNVRVNVSPPETVP